MAADYVLMNGRDTESHALGVQHVGGPEIAAGCCRSGPSGRNRAHRDDAARHAADDRQPDWAGALHASISRARASDARCCLTISVRIRALDVFLRERPADFVLGSRRQRRRLQHRGGGRGGVVAVGDDALISNGVWLRNHDMHALHDLASGRVSTGHRSRTVLERHVWLGQDALLLGCERIGMGAVIGARSLVKGRVKPPRVAVGGVPARMLREGVSWGRDLGGMTEAERLVIGLPAVVDACDGDRAAALLFGCGRPSASLEAVNDRCRRRGREDDVQPSDYFPHLDLLLKAMRIDRDRLNGRGKVAIDAQLLRRIIQSAIERQPFSAAFYRETYPGHRRR